MSNYLSKINYTKLLNIYSLNKNLIKSQKLIIQKNTATAVISSTIESFFSHALNASETTS